MTTSLATPAAGKGLRIAYWVVTGLLVLQLLAGVLDLLRIDAIRQSTQSVGFPLTILPLLGGLKILAALVLVFVRNAELRIATYAGAIFYFVGAVYAHLSVGQPLSQAAGALLTLLVAVASYTMWRKISGVPALLK